jgi:hypothetical protein
MRLADLLSQHAEGVDSMNSETHVDHRALTPLSAAISCGAVGEAR